MNVTTSVVERYSRGAKQRETELCCPVDYDRKLLDLLPREIIDKDYGCGDPSRYVQEGDVVLDLGSGGGKVCYMAAQLVGDSGQVIGVDMNDDMLALARKYQQEMATKLGGDRVTFYKGHIQDLALDVAAMEQYVAQHPDMDDKQSLQHWQEQQRRERPLIPDGSVDLVISNCVLNLVHDEDKQLLVNEIFRVLTPGGRVAISDIVSDKPVPEHLKQDGELWSGCISGAFQEQDFSRAFAQAGFRAVRYDKWEAQPWQVVEGIEFRSVTLTASKNISLEEGDGNHGVIYRGPFASVTDDEGNVYPRGARVAVSQHAYRVLTSGPHANDFIGTSLNSNCDAAPAATPDNHRGGCCC